MVGVIIIVFLNCLNGILIFYNIIFPTGKEARKKELKKNKRQRMMVRTAVLKGKDPEQLLQEMEKIDQMGMFIILVAVDGI